MPLPHTFEYKGLDKNFLDVVYVEFHMGYAHHSFLKFTNFPTLAPPRKIYGLP